MASCTLIDDGNVKSFLDSIDIVMTDCDGGFHANTPAFDGSLLIFIIPPTLDQLLIHGHQVAWQTGLDQSLERDFWKE